MALDTPIAVIICAALAFVYLVLYKKYKLIGNIGFMAVGLGVMSFDTTDQSNLLGMLILIGGIASLFIDIVFVMTKKREG